MEKLINKILQGLQIHIATYDDVAHVKRLVLDAAKSRTDRHKSQQFIGLGWDQNNRKEDNEKDDNSAKLSHRYLITVTHSGE
jgi:hypothetical protein